MKIIGGFASDVGRVRQVNQDSVFCKIENKKKEYFSLAAVCDGVGGLDHGEIASAYIVSFMEQWWNYVLDWIDIETVDSEILFAHLKDAVEEWNLSLYDYMRVHKIDMGTTMSLIMTIRNEYYIIQVGDSRVYLYRDGKLQQLTSDAAENRLKNGTMKSYLTNYMGMASELFFTTAVGLIEKDDLLFVCSDGLYHHLSLEDISIRETMYKNEKKLEKISKELIELMMERGETDNISIVMLSFIK